MSRMRHKIDLPLKLSNLLMGRVRKTPAHYHQYQFMRSAQIIRRECFSFHIPSRCFSSSYFCLQQHKPGLPNLEPKGHTTRKTAVKTKLFEKFLRYIQGYEVILEKLLPDVAFKFYKIFSNGTKLLFTDMKEFYWVFHQFSAKFNWEKACGTMTRKQLELYLTLPSELLRVAPVLVISAFPLAQNVIFPLALWAPKHLLSVHFWSDELKKEVDEKNLEFRQSYYRSVFRKLVKKFQPVSYKYEPQSPRIKSFLLVVKGSINRNNPPSHNDAIECKVRDSMHHIYKTNMQALATGQHLDVSEILKMAPYFKNSDGPLSLTKLSSTHVRYLLKIHNSKHVGLTSWYFPRRKLQVYANMILEIDKAIQRENPKSLYMKDLTNCCTVRGLNMSKASEQEAREYLDKWLGVSNQLQQDASSLLLHLPIFLGYNHQSRYWDDKTIT